MKRRWHIPGEDEGVPRPGPSLSSLSGHSAMMALSEWRSSPWIRLLLGGCLGLLFLLLALRRAPLAETAEALRGANGGLLMAALGSVLATTLVKAMRWKLALFPWHARLRLNRLFSVLLIGQTANSVLPGRVGELVRAYLLGELEGISKPWVLSTIVVEKLLDSLVLLIVLGALFPFIPLPDWLDPTGMALAAAFCFALLILILLARNRSGVDMRVGQVMERFPFSRRFALSPLVLSALRGLEPLAHWRAVVGLIALSALTWTLAMSTNFIALAAMNIVTPIWVSALLVVVLQVGSLIRVSPGQIGVFHFLCVATLSIAGVEKGPALAFSIVLHLVVYGPMILLGVLFMWRESFNLWKMPVLRSGGLIEPS